MSTGNVVGIGGAVDATVINGSNNPVSGNAVFDALAASGAGVTLDTDGTLAANSDTVAPSQKAAKTYIDTALAVLNLGTF